MLPVADGSFAVLDRGILALTPAMSGAPSGLGKYVPQFDTFPDDEYESVGKWRITQVTFGHECTITVEELKTRINIEIPRFVYKTGAETDEATFTYKNLESGAIGDTVPIAYGVVYGAKCTLIDTDSASGDQTYKIVGHEIDAVLRVYNSSNATTDPGSIDLTKAEFTITGGGAGTLYADIDAGYENPADCIEMLITDEDRGAGEDVTELFKPGSGDDDEGQGFGTYGSRTKWVIGETVMGTEVNRPAISLYLDSAEDMLEVVERVASFAMANVYVDRLGRYTCRAWEPVVSQGAFKLDASDIMDVVQVGDWTTPINKVTALYRKDYKTGNEQVAEQASVELQTRQGMPTEAVLEESVPFNNKVDAARWASQTLAMRGRPLRTIGVECSQRAMLLQPGDVVDVEYGRRDIDGIYEILEVTIQPGSFEVRLTLTNWRGYDDRPGFWVIDSPVFPTSLGGGAASPWDNTWTDAQKKWARENVGYWEDDNGFMDSNDLDSYKASVWV
jgi:hypothetical protein